MNGKYYPNNFDAIAAAPDEAFESITFEEFYAWRLCQWEMPASVECIIRAQRKDTGEVTEHVYQRSHAAQKRLLNYVLDGEHEITVADHERIHFLRHRNDTDDD